MDNQKVIESLSPIEREILPKLSEKYASVDSLTDEKLDKISITRGITFLSNKDLVETEESNEKIIDLGILGINYVKKELPERVLINKLSSQKSIPINEVKNVCSLNENEAKVAIGTLKSKALIAIEEGKVKLISNSDEIGKKFLEEVFLETLPRELDSLKPEEKYAFELLKKRKEIIEIIEKKELRVKLSNKGLEIKNSDFNLDLIEQVTPKLIKSQGWKGKKFRRYDLTLPVPKLNGGKTHFVNQGADYAKSIWLEMGFKEMTGEKTISGFYNFDSLFTAQDHPVREEHDTFYIKDLKADLPDKEIIKQIKNAHEGKCDNSLGWSTTWTEEESKKVLLRTHTTPLSIKTMHNLAKSKELPAKYFALGKCFRNETVDWSHGFEFNQTEGIVVDENANFRQLLGYLMQFFKKMGYEKVRVRPGYFPYTEPSLEIDAYNEERKKWVELGGAGMFRPEVTIPIFGKHIPVLAWGPGFDRIIMEFYEISDLREMYKNDITKLREMKFWRK